MATRSSCVAAALAACLTYGVGARAQAQLPVAYVDRPLTYPVGTLTPDVEFDILHPVALVRGGGLDGDTLGFAQLGAGYSLTNDLSVRGTAVNFQFNDPAQLASAGLGLTYRFLAGQFEMGVGFDWIYQTPSNGNGFAGQDILPSLPMRAHLGRAVRLDITPTLPISTAGVYIPYVGGVGGGKTTVGLDVPLVLNVQIVDQLHFGVGTGFDLTFNPSSSIAGTQVGDFFALPFGFNLGVSVPGPRGPIFDMTPFFVWPDFLVPAARGGTDAVQSGLWMTGINFTGFLYL